MAPQVILTKGPLTILPGRVTKPQISIVIGTNPVGAVNSGSYYFGFTVHEPRNDVGLSLGAIYPPG